MAQTDSDLLREFAASRSQSAFQSIVERHIDMAYAVAFRTIGNHALAKEACQNAFIALSKNAEILASHRSLRAWLFRVVRNAAIDLSKSESRRRRIEAQAAQEAMRDTTHESTLWREISPLIDETIAKLPEKDREAVLRRFFDNQPYERIGNALSLTPNAARMRTERALEKMRRSLFAKGIATTSALLASSLPANAAPSAPLGLGSSISATANSSSILSSILFLMTLKSKLSIAGAGLAIIIAATTGYLSFNHGYETGVEQSEFSGLSTVNHQGTTDTSPNQITATGATPEGQKVVQQSPIDLCSAFLSEADEFKRERLFHQLLASMTVETASSIFEMLLGDQARPHTYTENLKAFLKRWAIMDGSAAMNMAVSSLVSDNPRFTMRSTKMKEQTIGEMKRSVLNSWTIDNPEEALTWYQQSDDNSRQVITGMFEGLILNDPENAAKTARMFMEELDPEDRAKVHFRELVQQMAPNGVERIFSIADAIAEYETGIKNGIIGSLLSSGFALEVSTYLAKNQRDETNEPLIHARAAYAFSRKMGPEAALAWVNDLSEANKPNAYKQVYKQWAEREPLQAADAVETLPASEIRDQALAGVSQSLRAKFPETAIELASVIDDKELSEESMARAYERWIFEDEKAAETWRENLSPEEQNHLAQVQNKLRASERDRVYHDGVNMGMMKSK